MAKSQLLEIHPENPQQRLINQAVTTLKQGGLIIYPTDSLYALGCHIGDKQAMQRIRRIREVDDKHHLTLICRDLSEIANYALIGNAQYRMLKALTPGPFTFILKATGEVPRRLQHPKRKTIGLRVPENAIAQQILAALGEPILSSTLILPDHDEPATDADEIYEALGNQVELVIDGGNCGIEATTVLDMVEETPELIRQGKGDASAFLA